MDIKEEENQSLLAYRITKLEDTTAASFEKLEKATVARGE